MYKIKYNSQRDNYAWGGALPASIQCFYTSAIMFLSYYNTSYESYEYEKSYVDFTEAMVGKTGIAEKVPGWSGRSGAWYIVHQAALQTLLPEKNIIWDVQLSPDLLIEALQYSPVIYGASQIGNLPGGHIFTVIGYDKQKDEFIVHDPFGDATTNYANKDGAYKRYPRAYLKKYSTGQAIYAAPKVLGIAGKTGVKKKLFRLESYSLHGREYTLLSKHLPATAKKAQRV